MTRWIVTSFALHVAMVGFLYVASLHRRIPEPLPLRVKLLGAPEEPATEPPGDPAPTVAPAAPTPPPTVAKPKPTEPPPPKKPATPKPKPTTKRTAKPPPPQVKQEEKIDRRKLLDRVVKSRQRTEDLLSSPIPEPVVRPVVPPRPSTSKAQSTASTTGKLGFEAKGLEQYKDNYYFTMMGHILYQNWYVPKRPSGDRMRTAIISVLVLQNGDIVLNRCQWVAKSGKAEFDQSIWECIQRTDLPQLPAEFRKSEIEVTVIFQDEA